MHNKATLRKLSLGVLAVIATLAITIGVADAFTGPGSSGGVGNGAIASDGANNVTVGNSTVLGTTKLSVYASSTSASSYGFQVLSPSGGQTFYVRNDGAVSVSGTLAVSGGITSPLASNNVSSGSFGANTGGGDYSFPMRLAVGYLGLSTSTSYALNISGGDVIFQGNGRRLYFANSVGGTYSQNIYGGSSSGLNLYSDRALSLTGTDSNGRSLDFRAVGASGLNQFEATAMPTSSLDIYASWGQVGFSGPNYDGMASLKLTAQDSSYNTRTWSVQTTKGWDGGGAIAAGRLAFKYADNNLTTSAGTEVLSVLAGGRVGIGTSTPATALSVAGTIYSASGGYIFPDGTTQTTAASGASTMSAPNVSAGNFGANTGNGNYNFPANLGIGMPSPSYGFDINSTSSPLRVRDTAGRSYLTTATRTGTYGTCPTVDIAGRLTVDCSGPEGGNDSYIRHPVNSIFFFESENVTYPGNFYIRQKGGTYGLTVQQDTNGNVGINQTNPSQKLEVAGTIYSSSGGFKFPDGTTQTTAAGSATIPATNVSAGSFGANTGGGNYTFPGTVTLSTTGTGNLLSVGSTGTNVSRINANTGTGIAGISLSTNSKTWYIDNRGASDPTYPYGRLSILNNAGAEVAEFLESGQMVLGAPAGSTAYISYLGNDRLVVQSASNFTTSSIAFANASNINSRIWSDSYNLVLQTEDPYNIGASVQFYNNRTHVLANQITNAASGYGMFTYFNSGSNVGIGTSTPSYPLSVVGTIYSSSGGFRFPDGTTQTTAFSGSGSTVTAPNVSSGAFGANTGGGNYSFPASLTVGSTATGAKFNVDGGTSADQVRIGDIGGGYYYKIGRNTSTGWLEFSGTQSGYRGYVFNNADNIVFSSAANTRLAMQTSGANNLVGIDLAANTGGVQSHWFLDNRGGLDAPNNRFYIYGPSGENLTILSGGNVGIGASNPTYKFEVASGGATTARIGYSSGDTLTVGGGAGKIDVGTVDPIYQINGEKFATYLPSMIGVKEEVAGEMIISCDKGTCEKTIDFAKEEKGSDLWLFGKATNIKKHLPKASIMLTPAFDGRVSYQKGDGTLTIIANTFQPQSEVEVSYRFTAPRFDADEWSNRTDDGGTGFIIND